MAGSGPAYKSATLSIAWPRRQRQKIIPLFLPWLGCKRRCIFCSQEIQTGVNASSSRTEIAARLEDCYRNLSAKQDAPLPELAFYGGTFTALPETIWGDCLRFARGLLSERLISGFRCSTRPDSLTEQRLTELRAAGCQLVELGIQSFDDAALAKSRRGYSSADALNACALVARHELGPGIQLMPGMPGVTETVFLKDVNFAIEVGARCLRFYPCIALAGSQLAELWLRGEYIPWTLDQTLSALAQAWLMAARAQIPVIRMGLAPQPGLARAALAGPLHSALGSRVMGRALLLAITDMLKDNRERIQIFLPFWLQGCIWGWHGELANAWRDLGLGSENIHYWNKAEISVARI